MVNNNISLLKKIRLYEISSKLDYEKIQKLLEENKKLIEENEKLKNDLKLYTVNINTNND